MAFDRERDTTLSQRCGDDHLGVVEVELALQPDRYYVLIQSLAQPNAGVEPATDAIGKAALNTDVGILSGYRSMTGQSTARAARALEVILTVPAGRS